MRCGTYPGPIPCMAALMYRTAPVMRDQVTSCTDTSLSRPVFVDLINVNVLFHLLLKIHLLNNSGSVCNIACYCNEFTTTNTLHVFGNMYG